MKYDTQKIKEERGQCSLCAAKFEVWLDNLKIGEDREERIGRKLLSYCPVCTRVGDK